LAISTLIICRNVEIFKEYFFQRGNFVNKNREYFAIFRKNNSILYGTFQICEKISPNALSDRGRPQWHGIKALEARASLCKES
jgi:hypothetical protein